ncbi:MAG TPA: glycosyltransferase, partial [Roseivirga sp.]
HVDFEVIFINDHSTDHSVTVLYEALANAQFSWKLLELVEATGKKAALKLGIEKAGHEIIVTTDADCQMGPLWLQTISANFIDPAIQMVLGPIMLTGNSPWQTLQSIEYTPLVGITRIMAEQGQPMMANGGNLAYRKEAFFQVSGFDGIDQTPSGDDELLMHKISRQFPGGVVYQSSAEALVTSEALPEWKSFLNQRLRWASKWRVAKRPGTMGMAIFVVFIQLATLSMMVGLFLSPAYRMWFGIGLIIKLLIEFLFVWKIRRTYSFGTPILYFILCFILYPFYALYFGLAANFMNFEWKGRKYASGVK